MKKLFLSVLALMALASGVALAPSASAAPVGTGYSDTDWVEIQTAANYLATTPNTQVRNPQEMAKFGVATLHYLLAITGKLGTFQQDYSYLNVSGPNYLYADYTGDSLRDIQVVMQHYNASPAQAQYLGAAFMNFIAGVDAANKGKDWNTFRPGYVPPAPPAAPTALAAAAGTQAASLTWTGPSSSVTDYVVQFRAMPGGTFTTFADGVSVAPSATVTGLTPGTSYEFRVASVNAAGQGAFSTVATVDGCALTPYAVGGACGFTAWDAEHAAGLLALRSNVDTMACFSQTGANQYLTALNAAIADLPAGNLQRSWLEAGKGALDIYMANCAAKGWAGWYGDVVGFVAAGRVLQIADAARRPAVVAAPPAYEDPYYYWYTGFDGSKGIVLGANDTCQAGELVAIRDYLANYWRARPVANGIAGDINAAGFELGSSPNPGTSASSANQTMGQIATWLLNSNNFGCSTANIAEAKTLLTNALAATAPSGPTAPGAAVPGAAAGTADSRGAYLLPSERFPG
jgi:hypothetical protein